MAEPDDGDNRDDADDAAADTEGTTDDAAGDTRFREGHGSWRDGRAA